MLVSEEEFTRQRYTTGTGFLVLPRATLAASFDLEHLDLSGFSSISLLLAQTTSEIGPGGPVGGIGTATRV